MKEVSLNIFKISQTHSLIPEFCLIRMKEGGGTKKIYTTSLDKVTNEKLSPKIDFLDYQI